MDKQVKIIGLSVKKDFGALKAVNLTFDDKNRLTLIKGEVGSGKTTLNKAMRLGAQGGKTLEDSSLYGNDIELETQLLDGDRILNVGCKSDESGKLVYTLYEYDENGKKVQNPVIDGVKATPAAYLKELQTKLTWRLQELTSENPTTQRNLLLELYAFELEAKGVVFNKKSPSYVGGIIDQIEKAKEKRNYLDMKRKEVGGIADDLRKKGIDVDEKRKMYDIQAIKDEISALNAKIHLKKANVNETRANELLQLKSKGIEIASKLKDLNALIMQSNSKAEQAYKSVLNERKQAEDKIEKAHALIREVLSDENRIEIWQLIEQSFAKEYKAVEEPVLNKVLEFNEKGSIISDPNNWKGVNKEIYDLLIEYRSTLKDYQELNKRPIEEVDTTDLEQQVGDLKLRVQSYEEANKITNAVNAYQEWAEQNAIVNDLNKEYYLKLTEIETGVKGLKIVPEGINNDIFLMYDGSYDPKYFANHKKELRKLSAYSDTQKPMICLLIQNYLLRKKTKKLPYLWIDQVPLDKKTRDLLEKMSEELGLWLFVNWTGDFDKDSLQDGEILIENGEIFFN